MARISTKVKYVDTELSFGAGDHKYCVSRIMVDELVRVVCCLGPDERALTDRDQVERLVKNLCKFLPEQLIEAAGKYSSSVGYIRVDVLQDT